MLRDLADAERIGSIVRERRRIVVLGAGVLGLEIALAAARAGAEVCVVHHGDHPMPRNLDSGGGTVLRSALRHSGIAIIAHSRAEAISCHTDADGVDSFDALVTADGKQIRGDLLLLSCGVSPRTELATLAGLRTGHGIVVGPELRTWADPQIYAIGDCAHVVEHTAQTAQLQVLPGGASGLIGPGWHQAAWLAAPRWARRGGRSVRRRRWASRQAPGAAVSAGSRRTRRRAGLGAPASCARAVVRAAR
ncbi:FAD-dependent oxidoreductase [Luethyella okanaganae]|uniref:FAD-dependent oxidoreductase n=1 Tax=Luethyella okanaganae TaxID=69372 RepID=UPI0036DF6778